MYQKCSTERVPYCRVAPIFNDVAPFSQDFCKHPCILALSLFSAVKKKYLMLPNNVFVSAGLLHLKNNCSSEIDFNLQAITEIIGGVLVSHLNFCS